MPSLDDAINNAIERRGEKGKEAQTFLEKFKELAFAFEDNRDDPTPGLSERATKAINIAREQRESQAGAFGNEEAFQRGRAGQDRFGSFTTAERPSFPLAKGKKGGEALKQIQAADPGNKKLENILAGGGVNVHFEEGAGGPSGRILADNPLAGENTVTINVGFGRRMIVSGTKGARKRGLGLRLAGGRAKQAEASFLADEAKTARKRGFGPNIAAAARARQARQRARR